MERRTPAPLIFKKDINLVGVCVIHIYILAMYSEVLALLHGKLPNLSVEVFMGQVSDREGRCPLNLSRIGKIYPVFNMSMKSP